MAKIIDQDFIASLEGINFNLSAKIKNNTLGKRRSNAIGSSVEFSDYRQYTYGDDFRRIDWNAFARFEKLFIKRYMEEQEIPMMIFADYSKSMSFDTKKIALIKTVALFAFAQLSNYDSVAVCPIKKKVGEVPKYKRGRAEFYKIIASLEAEEFVGESQLLETVQNSIANLKKGYTLIVSDFLYEHKLEEVLSMLAYKKQRVILIHILNKDELSPNYQQDICLEDSEDKSKINLEISPFLYNLYQEQLQKYLNDIQNIAQRYGAEYFLFESEKGIESLIANLSGMSF